MDKAKSLTKNYRNKIATFARHYVFNFVVSFVVVAGMSPVSADTQRFC